MAVSPVSNSRTHFLYFLLCLITRVSMEDQTVVEITKEYCRGEAFEAECQPDEVIVMTSAIHGRMELGRCIKRDEKLGCQEDALLQMDSYCSGRHTCFENKITGELDIPACTGELVSHLKAGYTCMQVLMPDRGDCRIRDTNAILTLANIVTECGSVSSPWMLEVHSSQKINITLLDMGLYTPNQKHSPKSVDCIKYGSIQELNYGRDTTICGGQERVKHVMMSESNKVAIQLLPPIEIGNVHFMLKFKVLGCEDLVIPSDMWLKRGSGHVVVGCYSSRDIWRLDCVEDKWEGTIGNCTKALSPTPIVVQQEAIPESEAEMDMVAFSNEIGIAAAAVSSVFLSILLLVIGLLYDRRRTSQMEREIIQVHVSDEFSWSASSKKPIIQENVQTQTLTKDAKPHEGNPQNYQRTSEWCQGQRPPSHVDHIYDTPSYFDLDPDYMAQGNNGPFGTMANRDSYLQPTDGNQPGTQFNTLGNRDSYLQPTDNLNTGKNT